MISLLLGKAKTYLSTIFAASVALLGLALKWSLSSRKRLKQANKQLEADLEMKEKIEESDMEIDNKWSDRLREENLDKVPDHLSKPRKRL